MGPEAGEDRQRRERTQEKAHRETETRRMWKEQAGTGGCRRTDRMVAAPTLFMIIGSCAWSISAVCSCTYLQTHTRTL